MVRVRSVPGTPGWVTVASSRIGWPLASRSATTIRGWPASVDWYSCSTPYCPPPSRLTKPSRWAARLEFGPPPVCG